MKTYLSSTPLSDELVKILDDQNNRQKLVDMLLRRGHRPARTTSGKEEFKVGGHNVTVSSVSPIDQTTIGKLATAK